MGEGKGRVLNPGLKPLAGYVPMVTPQFCCFFSDTRLTSTKLGPLGMWGMIVSVDEVPHLFKVPT